MKKSNSAKGRKSYDSEVGGTLIPFFNRNVSEYPTEASGPKFDLVPVTKEKDNMLNVARLHAEQEYNRIMEVVTVLQKQANDIRRRLDITDMVHSAKYSFRVAVGQLYWLVMDTRKNQLILTGTSKTNWLNGVPPVHYDYIACVKSLGDYSWMEIEE